MIRLYYPFGIAITFSLCACTKVSRKFQQPLASDKNNVVLSSTNASTQAGFSGNDKIVFEGKNNLIDIIQEDSSYFDKHHDIVILKGNNNTIKLYNKNLVDLRDTEGDSLIIVGNNIKYVADYRGTLVIKTKKHQIDTVEITETQPNFEEFLNNFETNHDRMVNLKYFDEPVSVKYAINYFIDKIRTGNFEHYFHLGEMYLYGIGTEVSTNKAVELFEYAAAKQHILSIRQLGDIYKNGTFDFPKNLAKSGYYYKMGTQMGDEYCSEALNNH